jgi:DNA helicase-2/ATP-dependent DNA helicase PcrA
MPNNYTLLNEIDDEIDEIIQDCMNSFPRKSFSLFAGAGSGKTRSLVNLLHSIRGRQGTILFEQGQRVSVITYTRAASDQINIRLGYDPFFQVSTIHSFIWEQIKYHTEDIKDYLTESLKMKIQETEEKEAAGRKDSKASWGRLRDLEKYQNRLLNMENIRGFIYNPQGVNIEYNALSHSEVLDIGGYFLMEKKLFQKMFIQKYPILLIDESQDTHKQIMNALLKVEEYNSGVFAIGLFGDMMQRIYFNGDKNFNGLIKEKSDWMVVKKQMNHRSATRIIQLNNSIREKTDRLEQIARIDASEGATRIYLFPFNIQKNEAEEFVRNDMSEITRDDDWLDISKTKNLILEHHMAARRLGFDGFFMPLYEGEDLINRSALLDGSLREIRILTERIIPLLNEIRDDNESKNFRIMELLKGKGGIMEPNNSEISYGERRIVAMETIRQLENLLENKDITALDIVRCINDNKLFILPETLTRVSEIELNAIEDICESMDEERNKYDIWYKALSVPYEQIIVYNKYIKEETEFDTHQGVKGEEFPRVMAIMGNDEQRGWTFNFEKEFLEGKTSHTNNLFYVICSRAVESLALVMYTDNAEKLKKILIDNK